MHWLRAPPSEWDCTDDQPIEALARAAWWDEPRLLQLAQLFRALDPPEEELPSAASLASLLAERGISPEDVPDVCRAICRRPDGRLDLHAFQVGMMALDPHTTHGGLWNGIRAQ